MSLPFVGSGDTSQRTQSVPHPLKGVWTDFVEEDYKAEPADPERVQILGDVDEWPIKAPVWLHCPQSFRPPEAELYGPGFLI